MKRLFCTIAVALLAFLAIALSLILSSSSLSRKTHAQAPNPSLGYYGFTYDIKPPGQPISRYNIFGENKYVGSSMYYQTYAVHQLGPTVSSFERLRLRGRFWWQGETGCPLIQFDDAKKNWDNASGNYGQHYLIMLNIPGVPFPRYGVGSHQLVHPYSENLQGATPSAFRVSTYSNPSTGAASSAVWNGSFFGC